MEGITILQTIPTVEWVAGPNASFVVCIILAILSLIFSIWFFFDCDDFWIAGIVFSIFCGFIAFCCYQFSETVPGPNKYQVLIDENVSITEFTERYEIIEQQGITYIIMEKEKEEVE